MRLRKGGGKMRLITFQKFKAWEKVQKEGIYKCYFNSEYRQKLTSIYKKMTRLVQEKTDEDVFTPIWCWRRIDDTYVSSFKSVDLERCQGMTKLDDIAILLEVPDNLAVLTDFYRWVDVMYFTEYPDAPDLYCSHEELWANMFNIRKEQSIQACIPFIAKEHVLGVWQINEHGYQAKNIFQSFILKEG
ncbi:MAG: hypothetical protein ACOCQR_02985 [bacterium]